MYKGTTFIRKYDGRSLLCMVVQPLSYAMFNKTYLYTRTVWYVVLDDDGKVGLLNYMDESTYLYGCEQVSVDTLNYRRR